MPIDLDEHSIRDRVAHDMTQPAVVRGIREMISARGAAFRGEIEAAAAPG